MNQMIIAFLAASVAANIVHAIPVPTVCLCAENAVTNESGQVTKWVNSGSLGAALDLYPKSGTPSDAIRVVENGRLNLAVRLAGSDVMSASSTSDLGVSADVGWTWIAAGYRGTKSSGANYPLWGLNIDNGATRCGALFVGTGNSHEMRSYFYSTSKAVTSFFNDSVYGVDPCLFLLSATISDRSQYGYVSGLLDAAKTFSSEDIVINSGTFLLGDLGLENSSFKYFIGDVSELRIYNQPLTAAERISVECELAAKYKLDVRIDSESEISSSGISGFFGEVGAMGDAPQGGKSVAEVPVSIKSGALTVSFANAPVSETNSLVYLAHDALEGSERSWFVGGSSYARNGSICLSFDAAEYEASFKPCIYYREDSGAVWMKLKELSADNDGALQAELAAGWKNGQYTVRYLLPAVWFEASSGVSVLEGRVIGWKNKGMLGADLDLTASTDSRILLAEDGPYPKALRFDGQGFLQSAKMTDFGVTSKGGCTWFAALYQGKAIQNYTSIFGLGNETCPWFGVFYYPSKDQYRAHFSSVNDNLLFGEIVDDTPGCKILSCTADRLAIRGCASGEARWQSAAWSGDVPVGNLLVGDMGNPSYKKFTGDIAELRVYNRPLTALEHAEIEMEMAAHCNQAVVTAGAGMDPAAVRTHETDVGFLGKPEAERGEMGAAVYTWSDQVLMFAFVNDPLNAEKSLTYIASNGGAAEFVPNGNSEVFERTWYISSAVPQAGCKLEISCGAVEDPNIKYFIQCKAASESGFESVVEATSLSGGTAKFVLGNIGTGTYRMIRKQVRGLVLIVR